MKVPERFTRPSRTVRVHLAHRKVQTKPARVHCSWCDVRHAEYYSIAVEDADGLVTLLPLCRDCATRSSAFVPRLLSLVMGEAEELLTKRDGAGAIGPGR